MVPGPRGLLEPVRAARGVDAVARADAVLVPALAVDDGQAAGSVAAAAATTARLARVGPLIPLIALVYDDELVEHVPTEGHDIRSAPRPAREPGFTFYRCEIASPRSESSWSESREPFRGWICFSSRMSRVANLRPASRRVRAHIPVQPAPSAASRSRRVQKFSERCTADRVSRLRRPAQEGVLCGRDRLQGLGLLLPHGQPERFPRRRPGGQGQGQVVERVVLFLLRRTPAAATARRTRRPPRRPSPAKSSSASEKVA